MKILLVGINAKYIHTNPALYSLQAYVKAHDLLHSNIRANHIQIVEYTINNKKEQIIANIFKEKPSLIAISCYIWNVQYVKEMIVELKKIMPSVPIWLGGPEVSFHGSEFLQQYPMITGIMIGEGEQTFLELVEYYLECGKKLSHIQGIIYREECDKKSEIVETKSRELTDLNEIPFLYETLNPFENRILYYESSRGCPYRCSYCLSAIDKTVRLRSLDLVKRELQFFLHHNVPQVKFIDRTFNCNIQHAMEIWSFLHKNDNGVTNFHFEIATERMEEDAFLLLSKMRPGLIQLEIGVQSTNRLTLEEIKRVMSIEKLEDSVARIQSTKNIHIHLDLIAGLPYEDLESFQNSFNQVYSMAPHELQLGFLKVLKGSPMEEKLEEYELQYLSNSPYEVLSTKWLSYEELLRLKEIEEMVEMYYNSNQFQVTMKLLIGEFHTPYECYDALARFYMRKGYFITQPSRMYRYVVLLEFVLESCIGKEELYKEALTYDLYARENLKSRPSFAKDLSEEKDSIYKFYQSEEEERKILPHYEGYGSKQMRKMLHIEIFRELYKQKTYVLFDYKERNPLTYEAKTYKLTTLV